MVVKGFYKGPEFNPPQADKHNMSPDGEILKHLYRGVMICAK